MLGVDRAIGQQRIAKPAYRRGHHIQLIINLTVCGEFFVLHNDRHIVDTPLFGQTQQATFVIFNQHQACQPHGHLMARFAMLMRVEPASCRPLLGGKGHGALPARFYNPLRAAVDLARHFQPVPVQRRLFCQRVVNINGDGFSSAQLQRRAKHIAVIAPGGGVIFAKGHFTGLNHQLDTATGIGGQ